MWKTKLPESHADEYTDSDANTKAKAHAKTYTYSYSYSRIDNTDSYIS